MTDTHDGHTIDVGPVATGERTSFSAVDIARVCHEANRALQELNPESAPSPPWDQAPDWQRDSAIEGVKAVMAGATPEQAHESWCQHKVRDGWTYGETKDEEACTHPCLVPYEDLPPEQRAKDHVFVAIVRALASPPTKENA